MSDPAQTPTRVGYFVQESSVRALHSDHRAVSPYHCLCGWEGQSILTHALDVLALAPIDARTSGSNVDGGTG